MSYIQEMARKGFMRVRKGARNRYAQAGALLIVSGSALATEPPTLDTSSAISFIEGDVQDGIVAVGGALLVLAALAMGYKWIKAAFFS